MQTLKITFTNYSLQKVPVQINIPLRGCVVCNSLTKLNSTCVIEQQEQKKQNRIIVASAEWTGSQAAGMTDVVRNTCTTKSSNQFHRGYGLGTWSSLTLLTAFDTTAACAAEPTTNKVRPITSIYPYPCECSVNTHVAWQCLHNSATQVRSCRNPFPSYVTLSFDLLTLTTFPQGYSSRVAKPSVFFSYVLTHYWEYNYCHQQWQIYIHTLSTIWTETNTSTSSWRTGRSSNPLCIWNTANKTWPVLSVGASIICSGSGTVVVFSI